MKKMIALLLLTVFLTGCGAEETFEVIEDEIPAEPVVSPQQFVVSLPDDTLTPTFQSDSEELYVCEEYTISKQITQSGDLENTIKMISGKSREDLDVIQTQQENHDRYEFVWTSAGEDGLQVGRACILDDGNFHYILSVMATEDASGNMRNTLQDVFDSCKLLDPDVNLSTGS